jgi:hypothetical protein
MGKQYRFTATVPKHIYEWIVDTANEQGRKPSNLASFLLVRATQEEIDKEDKGGGKSEEHAA